MGGGVDRLDKEVMIRLDKAVMGITKKGNFDGLHNIPKKEELNMRLAVTFQKRKFLKRKCGPTIQQRK